MRLSAWIKLPVEVFFGLCKLKMPYTESKWLCSNSRKPWICTRVTNVSNVKGQRGKENFSITLTYSHPFMRVAGYSAHQRTCYPPLVCGPEYGLTKKRSIDKYSSKRDTSADAGTRMQLKDPTSILPFCRSNHG